MKKLIVFASLLVCPAALAEPAAKPAVMLEAAFKDAPGTWSCVGQWTLPGETKSFATRSKLRIVRVLGGHQYFGEVSMPKSEGMPAKECHIAWHYDPSAKMLADTTVCDDGYTSHSQSNGMQGNSTIWTGDATITGVPSKLRSTTTMKNPSEMLMVNELEVSDAWVKIGEETCRR